MPDSSRRTVDNLTASIADPNTTTGTESGAPGAVPVLSPALRYALGAEIAHGGMGTVYRGVDTTLGREVAIKVLQPRNASSGGAARRFTDEARITAQLQHPAIPPVHDLGTLPDGRPFLAMKLIKGETLDALLEARPDPAHDRGRFVAVFEQICQAVAYAHAHKVIHRDLKPANVMVGSFGEVQVMDWGLAKVLVGQVTEVGDPEETSDSTAIMSVRESDEAFTQAGSVLGTPAYMPPEQALGAIGKIDERSDAFGLGAVLAVILTGKPPFSANSAETTRIYAAQGNVADCFERLDGCGADPGLVALCKHCLAPNPVDRPSNAGAVARAVAELRAAADERARQAELDRVKAEGEKVAAELKAAEHRKRRRVQLALAAAVGVLLVAGGAFAWWQAEQARAVRDRLGRNAEAVAVLLDQCEGALRNGDAAQAAVALDAADKRLGEGGAETLSDRLQRCRADLIALGELEAVDRFRWSPVGNDAKPDPKVPGGYRLPDQVALAARYRSTFERIGYDPFKASAASVVARIASSSVRDRFVAAFDGWLWAEPDATVREVLRGADSNAFRDSVRDAMQGRDLVRVVSHAYQPEALNQPAGFIAVLSHMRELPVARKRELLAAGLRQQPGNVGLLNAMGETYPYLVGREQKYLLLDRVRWFQAAVAVAPKNPQSHTNLGVALRLYGETEQALVHLREATLLDPNNSAAYHELGLAYWDKHDLPAARDTFRRAVQLGDGNSDRASSLGMILTQMRDRDGAIAVLKGALRANPDHTASYETLGHILWDNFPPEGALAHCRELVRIAPRSPVARQYLARALTRAAGVRWLTGDPRGAREYLIELALAEQSNPEFHIRHGDSLLARGDPEGAIAAYREAVRLDPADDTHHIRLGSALSKKGDRTGSRDAFRKIAREGTATGHLYRADALRAIGDREEAMAAIQEAIRLEPGNPRPRFDLSSILWESGDRPGAIAALRAAVQADPHDATTYARLGQFLSETEDWDGAIAAFREEVRRQPGNEGAYVRLLQALQARGNPDEVATALSEASRFHPKRFPADAVERALRLRTALFGHSNMVYGVAFTPDGRLVSAGADGTARIWDPANRRTLNLLPPSSNAGVRALALRPDARHPERTEVILGTTDGRIAVWKPTSAAGGPTRWSPSQLLGTGHAQSVNTLAVVPGGDLLLSGSGDENGHGFKVWDLRTLRLVRTLKTDQVLGIAVRADGKQAATVELGGRLSLWNLETWEKTPIDSDGDHALDGLAYSPNGSVLACAVGRGGIRLRSATTGESLGFLSGHTDVVIGLAFAPGGRVLVSGAHDRTVRLWDVEKLSQLHQFEGHEHWVRGVALSPDGSTAASASWDRLVGLWAVPPAVRELIGSRDVAPAPRSKP